MLSITPINLDEANAFVAKHHRHHKPVSGAKFSLAVSDEVGAVRGVAIVGRPVARMADNGWTLEVNRCCTDGAVLGHKSQASTQRYSHHETKTLKDAIKRIA